MTTGSKYSRRCTKCGGSGMWVGPEEQNGLSYVTTPGACPECDGVGAIATPEGLEILSFISQWKRAGKLS